MKRPALYLITDDAPRSTDELLAIVCDAMAGGVTMVQFRERRLPGEALSRAIAPLAAACRAAGVPLLLNGAVCERLPAPVAADGVHLPARLLTRAAELCAMVTALPERAALVGYSAHGVQELREVSARGNISFATIGPIYPTPSKAGILEPTTPAILAKCRDEMPSLPVLALGGVGLGEAAECMRHGASGVAVMRAIMSAPRPREAARELVAAMAAGEARH